MFRLAIYATVGLLLLGLAAFHGKLFRGSYHARAGDGPDAAAMAEANPAAPGKALYANLNPQAAASVTPAAVALNPIVIPECRLSVIEKEEVPGPHNGFLHFVGTEIKPGEQVPPDRVVSVTIGGEEKTFRQLKEGDVVEAGQLLGQLDDRLARDEWNMKRTKLEAGKAELAGAEKVRDEAEKRYQTQLRLQEGLGGTTPEAVREAKLNWEKAYFDALGKQEALRLSNLEVSEALTVLQLHEVRSKIPGVVKTISKHPGEAVRSSEPLFLIQNLSTLRVEGLVEAQYLPALHVGMKVVIEPAQAESPELVLNGHLQEITSVAVNKDLNNPLIVSASEDGTVRVWDPVSRRERRVLRHPAAVRCVACTGPTATPNWCLTGAADGDARIWNLDSSTGESLHELKGQHQGAVTAVAFAPNGKVCATGGDDRVICLWDTTTGQLLYRLPPGHRGPVTSLQFTPQSQLVSAGRDNTLRLWTLGEQGAKLQATFDRRSGDVTCPGASQDGRRVLFDQDKSLRVLVLPTGQTESVLQDASEATNFTTVALFSPDARLILTGNASEGRLQLWRTPNETSRGYELRRLAFADHSPATCAAFSPDGSFVVSGTRDRQVLVWPVPSPAEIERQLLAIVTRIDPSVESSAGQVRIWAELANPDGRLLPGTTVTMAVYPQ